MIPKEDRYRELLPQIKALMEKEQDPVANMANLAAVLKEAFQFSPLLIARAIIAKILTRSEC